MNRRRAVNAVITVFVAGAAIVAGAGRMWEIGRTARRVAELPYELRRDALLGAYYPAVRELRSAFRTEKSVDLIWRDLRDIDTAIFTNYYLYPRLRQFSQLDPWRSTRRRPDEKLLWIDTRTSPEPRVVDYLQARSENGRGKFETGKLLQSGVVQSGRFIIPLVCSIDGAPPDEYVVPLCVTNESSDAVDLRLAYHDRDGWAESRRITIPPRGMYVADDALVKLFGRMGIGWIEGESTGPVQIGAALFNSGRSSSSLLRVAPPAPKGYLTAAGLQFKGEAPKLFFINPGDGWATLDLDANASDRRLSIRIQLAPFELRTIDDPATRIAGTPCADCAWSVTYQADRPVFAYASRQDHEQATHFAWVTE